MKTIKIKDKQINKDSPCFIIAEASSNHGGELSRAKKLIEEAAKACADAVKFQLFKAEKITADTDDPRTIVKAGVFVEKDTKLIDLYKNHELPREWLPELFDHAHKNNILFMATPFDEEAVDLLEKIDMPAYKNASYELLDVPLLRKIAKTKKPVILSTGMADCDEIAFAIKILEDAGCNEIVLLHCTSTYPLPPDQANLRAIGTIKKTFPDFTVGFSDHSTGISIPIAAVALGAKVIEKHLMLGDGKHAVDEKLSLTPDVFKKMVCAIRETEQALGTGEKKPTSQEKEEIIRARRSLWVIQDIAEGEALTEENIGVLRPGIGLSPMQYDEVIGKKASRLLEAQNPLSRDDFN